MKKRVYKIAAAAMAAVLAGSVLFPSEIVRAQGESMTLYKDISTQTSSAPENVYLNEYAGTVRSQNFDDNWKFYLGDASGAQDKGYNDSKWEEVSLPHDYSISQKYSSSLEAESAYLPGGTGWYRKNFVLDSSLEGKRIRIDFGGVYMNSTVWVNGQKLGTHPYGYTPFSYDITDYVQFGTENTISVKVEHKVPSSRFYSGSGIYRSVNLTVTDSVHVDLYGTKITTPNLSTQTGSNVDVNISTAVVNDSAASASVSLKYTIFKKGNESAVIGTGTAAAKTVAAGQKAEFSSVVKATSPDLWSVNSPNLYTVRTEVQMDGKTVDTYDTEYGFRYFDFDSDTGFSLNGQKMKLKGVCMHHDQGSLGAAAYRRATQRQVEILKEMGCNAIRVTHNPASDVLIEECNRQGMLLIEEAFDGWIGVKNGNSNDYSTWFSKTVEGDNKIMGASSGMTWAQFDLNAMIKRGYNSPAIIAWSLGNEMGEGAGGLSDAYRNTQSNLIRWAQAIDTTRPVTTGDNKLKHNLAIANSMADDLTDASGIVGANYSKSNDGSNLNYDQIHRNHPTWKLYGSETASAVNSRGKYNSMASQSDIGGQQLTSYDTSAVGWGAVASSAWYEVITRDFVAGEFVWTGFDYLGEPTPWNGVYAGAQGTWPSPKNSYFGIIDTAGFPKDSFYLYQSQWNDEVNTLHVLPAWKSNLVYRDSSNGGNVPVVVYSDAAKVELFFTGTNGTRTSLGAKSFTTKTTEAGFTYQVYEGTGKSSTDHKNLYLTWYVPYADGMIEAVAYDKEGKVIQNTQGRSFVTTTGEASKLSAKADRTAIDADGSDLSYITVDVLDSNGNIVPDAANRVTFEVKGDGELVGVDNGSSPDHDSYQADNRKAFSGKVLGIVKSTKKAGSVEVTVKADGLQSDKVVIKTNPVAEETAEKKIAGFVMSKNYYVKTGNMPQLPGVLNVWYTDGSEAAVNVKWDDIDASKIEKSGTFTVSGAVDSGEKVSVNIYMIDKVAALLNYSTTTQIGVAPILPDARPAVMEDGEVLTATFPVEWETKAATSYANAGNVVVNGKADVFGEELTLTATVRVQDETLTIGDNIGPQALEVKQNIPEGKQSDTLSAIIDGSTAISANNQGGANPTGWSNWAWSKEGNTDSEITLSYATQQRIGKMTIHFWKDGGAATFPDAGTTKIYVSDTGNDGTWTELVTQETIGTESNRVKPYTYSFAPVMATFVKIVITNSTDKGNKAFTCTGITEVEINKVTGTFITNRTAAIESLKVNDDTVTSASIAEGFYSTPATVIGELDCVTTGNASLTVLPEYEGVVRLILESEDHSAKSAFEIRLGADVAESDSDANDSSRDYDRLKIKATAGSEHAATGNEGPASNVLDNNASSLWHTKWSSPAATPDQFWITLTLDEPAKIDALRYCARSNGHNGRVKDYKVEVLLEDGTTWKEVSTGTWDNKAGYQLATFDPVTAKAVKLTGVHTYGDRADAFMSAAEMRVRLASESEDISDATMSIEPSEVKVSLVDAEHPAVPDNITVTTKDGKELRYGIDYVVSYEGNTSVGTATVKAKGILKYSGTVTGTFEIVKGERKPVSIAVTGGPNKTVYTEGNSFDPAGLKITVSYDDGSTQVVTYGSANASQFKFSPAGALTVGQKAVTVTYKNMTAEISVTVQDKGSVNPGTAYKKGDVNGDGNVNLVDLRHMLRYICGKEQLSEKALEAGDVAGQDGKVNLLDLRTLLRYICGKIDSL